MVLLNAASPDKTGKSRAVISVIIAFAAERLNYNKRSGAKNQKGTLPRDVSTRFACLT